MFGCKFTVLSAAAAAVHLSAVARRSARPRPTGPPHFLASHLARRVVMMAFDSRSTPEPRPISDPVRALLADAVLRAWEEPARWQRGADGGATSDVGAALAAALGRVVAEARERALRAEEVVVAFKALLASLPELNVPERRLEAVHFRERLITECIRAYYRR